MGQRLIALAHADPQLNLVQAIDHAENAGIGQDAGLIAGVGAIAIELSTELVTAAGACAVIDFSTPAGAQMAVDFCRESETPLVMATTGLESSTIDELKIAAETIPIVWAPSMSLAVNLMMKVTDLVGRTLKAHVSPVDVEIIERHHRFKVDSPSGTALKFGQIVGEAMDIDQYQHGREGIVGQRPANEIGYHAIRAGDDAGQHTILFGMAGETIELKVAASNRDCYATGALQAAKFLVGRDPGLYDMYDVLGLND